MGKVNKNYKVAKILDSKLNALLIGKLKLGFTFTSCTIHCSVYTSYKNANPIFCLIESDKAK